MRLMAPERVKKLLTAETAETAEKKP